MSIWQRSLDWLLETFSPQTSQPPLPKLLVDYEFTGIILAEEHVDAIRLLTGPFANVVIYYGMVKVIPEGDTHRQPINAKNWIKKNNADNNTDVIKNRT